MLWSSWCGRAIRANRQLMLKSGPVPQPASRLVQGSVTRIVGSLGHSYQNRFRQTRSVECHSTSSIQRLLVVATDLINEERSTLACWTINHVKVSGGKVASGEIARRVPPDRIEPLVGVLRLIFLDHCAGSPGTGLSIDVMPRADAIPDFEFNIGHCGHHVRPA